MGVSLRLNATEIFPGPNCVVTAALTSPYVFLRVLSVDRVEYVVMTSKVIDCEVPQPCAQADGVTVAWLNR